MNNLMGVTCPENGHRGADREVFSSWLSVPGASHNDSNSSLNLTERT